MSEILCEHCLARGHQRQAIREFRGQMYCSSCEREWIKAVEKAPNHLVAFAHNLRRLLKRAGYTGREMARRIGVSEVMFARYMKEGEASGTPTLERFAALCLALGTTPNALLGFTEPEFQAVKAERDRYLGIISQTHSLTDLRWAEQEREAIARSGLVDGLTPTQVEAVRASNNAAAAPPGTVVKTAEPDYRTW